MEKIIPETDLENTEDEEEEEEEEERQVLIAKVKYTKNMIQKTHKAFKTPFAKPQKKKKHLSSRKQVYGPIIKMFKKDLQEALDKAYGNN